MTDELDDLLSRASADERRVFTVIARRVMGAGRKNYGPLILANDPRDFQTEGADELADYLWYRACEEVRLADVKRQTVASFDVSDVTGDVLEVLK